MTAATWLSLIFNVINVEILSVATTFIFYLDHILAELTSESCHWVKQKTAHNALLWCLAQASLALASERSWLKAEGAALGRRSSVTAPPSLGNVAIKTAPKETREKKKNLKWQRGSSPVRWFGPRGHASRPLAVTTVTVVSEVIGRFPDILL